MQTALFWALLSLLAVRQCHAAVTWKTVGCNGWSYKGATINAIWDNALLMTTNAQSRIAAIPTSAKALVNPTARKAGVNANFMYGINFNKVTGMNAAGAVTMQKANAIYANIQRGLQGTLPGVNPNNAYLFCGGNDLTNGNFPGNPFLADVWHAQVKNGKNTEYIILQYATDKNADRPCSEVGANRLYQGKTFDAIQVVNGKTQTFPAIILCPNQWQAARLPIVPTLASGFPAVASGKNKNPTPSDYNSVAGSLVHEMTHVVGRSQGQRWLDPVGGFDQCVNLASTNQNAALINPDTYRVFAEMSMSPATTWGPGTS